MLKNYLRVALRTLRRQKAYAAINILGLAAGIACCLFLLLFVRDELSYDRFHENADSIFRVNLSEEDEPNDIALTPTIVAPLLHRTFPEVLATVRIDASSGLISVGEKSFNERGFFFADSGFFDVFTFPLIQGDATSALSRPYTVVLTESMARKYFGDEDPMGRVVTRSNSQEYEVTGVMEDVPSNSHMSFNFVASFASREYWASNEMWGSANFYSFVRLGGPEQKAGLETKTAELLAGLRAEVEQPRDLVFQPLTDIHLSSGVEYEIDNSGDMASVIGFATLAILILLMACINYMNLATARSTLRAKEVGLRKSLGAYRKQLIGQFYGEAVVMTSLAIVLGFGIVAVGLPWFNQLSWKSIAASQLVSGPVLALAIAVFVVVGLVAGSYPAFFLAAIEPARALRGRIRAGRSSGRFRKGLVVVQFAISAFLIVGTIVVMNQVRYMQVANLGFDKEHIVEVPINDPVLFRSYEAIRQQLEASSAIVAVSAVNQLPGQLGWTSSFRGPGMSEEDEFSVKGMPVDAGVVEALGLEVIAGAPFPSTPSVPDSVTHQFILNETAVSRMGWTPAEAVSQRVGVPPRYGEVIGVVRDFNFNTMHDAIEPLAIWYQPREKRHIVVRVAPNEAEAAVRHIENTLTAFAPDLPISFRFIDTIYNSQYASERRTKDVVGVFAILAIVVACLGLLGLASFTAEKRTREIGVRKVLGASVASIVALLSKDFLQLVGVAFVIAIPATWLILNRWLDGFAYTVSLGPGVFAIAAVVVSAIALLTVSTQAFRAAVADPVKSLRYD